ncbi:MULTISPECIES: TonB-dependent receptor [unclassified Carboxylicivirga]|uniref:TonB-dependent receptor n=1 Tax=Carboxylicivirga TaxID=1628153 RepID=UPI003D345B29
MRALILLSLFFYSFGLWAQNTSNCLQGRVVAADDGGAIPFAHLRTPDGLLGTVSDANGDFSLCGFTEAHTQLIVGHTAFETKTITINPECSAHLTVHLSIKIYEAAEVKVLATRNSLVKSPTPGKLTLKNEDVLALPAFMGSPDVLRGLQLLPGMQSVSEGNGGIYVRGGSPGQNYVLFDHIELMNPTHLMGVYSVFNPLLSTKVDFYKGNAPLHLSGRLASSILVESEYQKRDSSNWAGNVGNVVTNLSYRAQSRDEKWFVSTGLRRSYLDVLAGMTSLFVSDEQNYFKQNDYAFYDWNGKVSYSTANNRIQLSWYLGQDNFRMQAYNSTIKSQARWGNKGAALHWYKSLCPGLSMSNTLSYSSYGSEFGASLPDGRMRFASNYRQMSLSNYFSYEKGGQLWRWGFTLKGYDVSPQELEVSNFTDHSAATHQYRSAALRCFISNHFNLSSKWTASLGAALNIYRYPDAFPTQGAITHGSAFQLKPNVRATLSYAQQPNAACKLSYAFNTQDMHLASMASIPLPTDIWMPATRQLPIEEGHQFTAGYFQSLPALNIEWGIEGYAKYMNNMLLLKLNSEMTQQHNFEESFYAGRGLAWGSELYLQQRADKMNFTLSYTLGWTRQQFDGINQGRWHDAKYDRRNDLNLQASYLLNQRLDVSTVFVYATGNKATLPTGRYWLMGSIANDYAGVNNYRMPAYHRMDVSMNYKLRSKFFHESVLSLSVINIYGRSNPYYIYFRVEEGQDDYELSITARQVSLFPIMPAISWRFKF